MTKSNLKPFVTGAILLLSFSIFAQKPNDFQDIILKDISNRFQVTIPGALNKTIKQTEVFNIAIVPMDLIGALKLPWQDNKEQLSNESEVEFENNMLNCVSGKDWKFVKIIKRKQYCERIGYSDAAMGKYFEFHYCSFLKENKLVIIEYGMKCSTCSNENSVKENKRCELEKNKKQKFIDIGIAEIIFQMKIVKI
jgi:hypothetical protein